MADEAVAAAWENSSAAREELAGSAPAPIVRRAVALGRQMLDPLAVLASLCGGGGGVKAGREVLALSLHPLQAQVGGRGAAALALETSGALPPAASGEQEQPVTLQQACTPCPPARAGAAWHRFMATRIRCIASSLAAPADADAGPVPRPLPLPCLQLGEDERLAMVERVMTTATSQVPAAAACCRLLLCAAQRGNPCRPAWAACTADAAVAMAPPLEALLLNLPPSPGHLPAQVGIDLNAVASCAWLSTPLQFVPG